MSGYRPAAKPATIQEITATFLLLVIGISLAGCMVVRKPSPDELRALDHPPPAVAAKLEHFFPRAQVWIESIEAQYRPQGRALTDAEQATAQRLGVLQPDQVRVVVVDTFPLPEDPELRHEAERYGMGSMFEGARTMGYVVLLKPKLADDTTVLRHELVHVAQHDRMGRAAFIRRYLTEMEIMGYARSPLELEAYAKQGAEEAP